MAIQVGWRRSNLEFGLGVALAGAGKPVLVLSTFLEMVILHQHSQPLKMMRQSSKLIVFSTVFDGD